MYNLIGLCNSLRDEGACTSGLVNVTLIVCYMSECKEWVVVVVVVVVVVPPHNATVCSGPRPPLCRGVTITHRKKE
jgi:hypothetical protein